MGRARIRPARESSVGANVMMGLDAHGPAWVCDRAVDGARNVALGREVVTVGRRIAGLDARINIPTRSFRGVALKALRDGSFEILLLHMDPGLSIRLAAAPDDADVIALWRLFGRRTGLPLLVEDADGRLQPMSEEAPAKPASRRRGSAVRSRRPRFLARRAVGRAGPTANRVAGRDLFARA